MTENINLRRLPFSDSEHADLLSLSGWMEFFGLFYYIVSGMFAFAAFFVMIIGILSAGGHTLTLIGVSIILVVYCVLSIYLSTNLFKSSEKFRLVVSNDDNQENLMLGFEKLIRFFWFVGTMILLSFVWLFFV